MSNELDTVESATSIKFAFMPHELRNIAYFFVCNVLDNVQARADFNGEYKWGKEDASHLIVSAIDTFRTLDDDIWQATRNELLGRYKGR